MKYLKRRFFFHLLAEVADSQVTVCLLVECDHKVCYESLIINSTGTLFMDRRTIGAVCDSQPLFEVLLYTICNL